MLTDYYKDKYVRYGLNRNGEIYTITETEVYDGKITEWNRSDNSLTIAGMQFQLNNEKIIDQLNSEKKVIGRNVKGYYVRNNLDGHELCKLTFINTVIEDGIVKIYEDDNLVSSKALSEYCDTYLNITPDSSQVDFEKRIDKAGFHGSESDVFKSVDR